MSGSDTSRGDTQESATYTKRQALVTGPSAFRYYADRQLPAKAASRQRGNSLQQVKSLSPKSLESTRKTRGRYHQRGASSRKGKTKIIQRSDQLCTKYKPVQPVPYPVVRNQISFETLTRTKKLPTSNRNSNVSQLLSEKERYIPRPQPFRRQCSMKLQSSKGSMLMVCPDSEQPEQEQNLRLINLLHSTDHKTEQDGQFQQLHPISQAPECQTNPTCNNWEQLVHEKRQLLVEQTKIRARLRTVNLLLSHRRTCSESGPWRNLKHQRRQSNEFVRHA